MRTNWAHMTLGCVLVAAVLGCNSGDTTDDEIECGPGGSCPSGYVCDVRTNKCVMGAGIRDAALDGQPDGALVDAAPGVPDARTFDGRPDAPQLPDAPPPPDARVADAAPGDTTLLTGPEARTMSLTATFTFTGGASYQCSLDHGAFAPCTSPHNVTVVEGTHHFEVAAITSMGAVDPTPADWDWVVDRTGPMLTVDGVVNGSTVGRNPTFLFSVEAGATVSCALDSTTLAACDGGEKGYTLLAGGAHVFRARAKDTVGNDGPLVTINFTVDAVGPTTLIDPLPNDLSDPAGTITYSSEAGATFECRINNGGYASCPAAGFAFSGLPAGRNVFRVRGTDQYGNLGTEASYAWEVFGTVNVTVAYAGTPQVGAAVISHRSDGSVLDETKTGDGGKATARVLPDSQLTAGILLINPQTGAGSRILVSMLDVDPGDNAQLAVGVSAASVARLNVTGDSKAPDADSYRLSLGGVPIYDSDSQPALNGLWDVADDSYDSAGRINFLGQLIIRSRVMAFLPIAGLDVARGVITNLSLPAGDWVASVPWDLQVVGLAGFTYASLEPGVYRNGVPYPIAEELGVQVSDSEFRVQLDVPPAGFADGRYVRFRVHAAPAYKAMIATDVDTLDATKMLPSITDGGIDSTSPSRPIVTWAADGAMTGTDGLIALFSWSTEGGQGGLWYLIAPTMDKVPVPALPASLPWAPTASSTFTALLIEVIESSAISGYAEFKSVHPKFLDGSSSTITATHQEPPVVPGRNTVTRISEYVRSLLR